MKTQFDLVALYRVSLILEEFRKVYSEMPLQMAVTLLTVAANPGLTVSEVAQKSGNTMSSTSRHMQVLGPWNEVKKEGFGLITIDHTLADRRSKVVLMTPAGARVINSLIDLIKR